MNELLRGWNYELLESTTTTTPLFSSTERFAEWYCFFLKCVYNEQLSRLVIHIRGIAPEKDC